MELLDTTRFTAPSFTRTTYHSTEADRFWRPHIQRASVMVQVAEMESIARGLRKCGTIHIPNIGGDLVYAQLARKGLFWRRLTQVGQSAGFSHRRHAPVQQGNPNFTWFSVMGSSQKVVDAWALAYKASNHNQMGKLLGFPKCCREFFIKNWPDYCDPIWQAGLNTPGVKEVGERRIHVKGHPGANGMLRYIGARTTFHIPCNMQCEGSIANSEAWLDMMHEVDELAATSVRYLLSLPLAWDVCHGYLKVMTPAFTVHAGSIESAYRHIVEYDAEKSALPDDEIPGAVNGLVWPMRPGDLNTAPLVAAGGLPV